jgi:hypothetical protein
MTFPDILFATIVPIAIAFLVYVCHRFPPKIVYRYEKDDGTVSWMQAQRDAEEKEKRARGRI